MNVFKRYNTVSKEELKALVGGIPLDRHLYGHLKKKGLAFGELTP